MIFSISFLICLRVDILFIVNFIWYYHSWLALVFLVLSISNCTTYYCTNIFPVYFSPMMNTLYLGVFYFFHQYSHLYLVVVGSINYIDLVCDFLRTFVVVFIVNFYLSLVQFLLVIIIAYFFLFLFFFLLVLLLSLLLINSLLL